MFAPGRLATATKRRTFCGALLIALIVPISVAQAGNDDGILVGGQAALTGGAVTAIASDGAAAWYNPAGLARITRHSFDINASAYGVSLISAKKLFTLPNGQTADADAIDWQLIPTALSYSRVLSKRVVGSFGVFIPYTTDLDLRASVKQPDGIKWVIGLDQVRNEYDYIASIGVRVSDTLRVGVALHGIYVSIENNVQLASGMSGVTERAFSSTSQHETRGEYGLRLAVGVQWTPNERFELGLSAQTPTLTGFRSIASDSVSGLFPGGMQGVFESEHIDTVRQPWDLSTPFSLRAGAAYRLGRAQLLVDGSLSSPLDTEGTSFDRRLSGNARLGVLVQHSELLSYGAGAFSDRNGLREAYANFYGISGGVRVASDYTISEGQRRLTFATTLAGRYAYGAGKTAAASLDYDAQGEPPYADVRIHELAFNLGGGVTF